MVLPLIKASTMPSSQRTEHGKSDLEPYSSIKIFDPEESFEFQ
jgi:hypothetical protein